MASPNFVLGLIVYGTRNSPDESLKIKTKRPSGVGYKSNTRTKVRLKMTVEIDKVIMVCIDYDDLQAISWELNTSDYWADLTEVSENELMQSLITPEQFEALKNKEADYIVFREDN